ncbi:MAG: Por secretion system protein [Prevotella sp.]|nr:Por secretion system protein [Prevotella sp.]
MKRNIITSLILLLFFSSGTMAQTGQWKSYLSYYEPTEIEEGSGNMLYVLASNGLYSYDEDDQSVQTYDKTTVLNDCGIAHIAWNSSAKRLVIVYQNYNIDLLSTSSDVVNIADYMNKSMTEDKTVNGIDVSGAYAYLSTAFGIVKINVADAQISDTYQLGFDVEYTYVDGGYLYAASSTQGLYRGLMTSNLLDKANWTRVGNYVARPKTMDADKLALVKTLNIDGPKYNYFGRMLFQNGLLYTVGGGYTVVNDLHRPGCIQVLSGDKWTIYQDDIESTTGVQFVDLNSVTIDPKDTSHVFASGRTGLYEYRNGKFQKLYTYDNSPLISAFTTNKNYVVVQDAAFDSNGSLWCLNSLNNSQNILELNTSSEWVSHRSDALLNNGSGLANMQQILFDSRSLMWFVNDSHVLPSFYAYQPSTGNINSYKSFVNEDGSTLSPTYIHAIAEDQNQNIWIGTNIGPLMLESDQITADSPVLTQVKVPRNDGTNYADYLLSGVDISCMVIDQANRKWFGTNGNGIFLISADNIHQLLHLTQSNSQLLSNNIESMAINPTTGELFIGTDKGLCSYMTNATTAADGMTKDNVYAYPNPVRPDYAGAITITGLDEDADVKIVTANGTLVNSGRASGGLYKWYGLDQSGRRVASGVYMVEVATADGEKGVVCKIAIVN